VTTALRPRPPATRDSTPVGRRSWQTPPVTGERDLTTLLATLRPERHPGTFVFTTSRAGVPGGASPVATVVEDEGLTLVLPRAQADALGLPYDFTASWITLRVHSALDAVGLTAAVAVALAEAGIPCNVVAGNHHDHLFVPADHSDAALTILAGIAAARR
jgi:hypothetical protein